MWTVAMEDICATAMFSDCPKQTRPNAMAAATCSQYMHPCRTIPIQKAHKHALPHHETNQHAHIVQPLGNNRSKPQHFKRCKNPTYCKYPYGSFMKTSIFSKNQEQAPAQAHNQSASSQWGTLTSSTSERSRE